MCIRDRTLGRRGLLVPGKFFLCYSEEGGPLLIFGDDVPQHYRIVEPRTGAVVRSGVRPREQREWIPAEWGAPLLYIFCDE